MNENQKLVKEIHKELMRITLEKGVFLNEKTDSEIEEWVKRATDEVKKKRAIKKQSNT